MNMTGQANGPRTTLGRFGLALVALVAIFGLAACEPSGAAGTVTATGTGTPLSGVSVQAFSSTSETLVAEVVTANDGTYSFGGALPDGTYRLRFDRSSWHGGSDWAAADDVAVSISAPVSVDHSIAAPSASISGAVAVNPIMNDFATFSVTVRNTRSGWSKTVSSPWGTPMDVPWSYTVTGLPAGDYTVRAEFNRYTGDSWMGQRPWSYAPASHVLSGAQVVALPAAASASNVNVSISSDTVSLFVYTGDGYGYHRPDVYAIDANGELLTKLLGTLNDARYLGLARVPFRLLIVPRESPVAPHLAGATPDNPLGTLYGVESTYISVTVNPPSPPAP